MNSKARILLIGNIVHDYGVQILIQLYIGMYSFKNLNKARVLKKLKIKSAKIPYLISFTEKEFNDKNTKILNLINNAFKSRVAIQSIIQF